ncbi:MAG TPA: HEAT repeat domain-containing protein, partial [Candidatus Polarisedimenticolaceae bacterium]|nr:HEAT repeat domain-containing protein [Candidatus Polarisedimenticolaceae bacterium]
MNLRLALAGLTLVTLPAAALEAPATFENARVEVRTGVTPAAALEQARKDKGTTWVGWSVEAIPKTGDVCCFANNFKRRGCSLAERESSWGSTDNRTSLSSEVYILVEIKESTPSRVKILSPSCQVDGADRRVVWLGPVEAQASIAVLDRLVDRDDDKVSETALVAIAYHRDARADELLEKRALDRSARSDVREQAIFWSGQTRGAAGLKTLDRVMATETDGDLRQNAVFSMSQSDEPGAVDRIKRAAVEDKDPDVRGHALFSLSQTKDKTVG